MPTRVGIIAEYNPFHEGHRYHISEVKKQFPDADIVVFMSGDFVQRGEPAIISKYFRAREAIKGGADIVLSPPVFASVSAAGDFAYYGVKGLMSAGCDAISFGCEDPEIAGNMQDIQKVVDLEKTFEYNEKIKAHMRSGMTYPAAREEAIRSSGYLSDLILDKIKKPNNLLAFEYMRALCVLNRGKNIRLIPIQREGMDYHERSTDKQSGNRYPSAEYIRNQLAEDRIDDMGDLSSLKDLRDYLEKYNPAFADDLSQMLFYRLAYAGSQELSEIRDCDGKLANRIKNLLPQYENFTQFTELVKSKDVTYTRVSRVFINILLDIKDVPAELPYMYVLGCRKEKKHLLSDIMNGTHGYDTDILVTGKDADALIKNDKTSITETYFRSDRLAYDLFCRLANKNGNERLLEMFREFVFI